MLTFSGFLDFGMVICVLITGKFLWGYSSGQRHHPVASGNKMITAKLLPVAHEWLRKQNF